MPPTEKRANSRPAGLADSTFIEIEHTFGPTAKSVYRVLEHTDYGVSFIVPVADGYFLADTPCKFVLVNTAKPFRRMHMGVIRYHQPWFREDGERFYRIGVEIRSTLKGRVDARLKPRSKRLAATDGDTVRIVVAGRAHEFPLIDYSRYGAAFHLKGGDHGFSPSLREPLKDVRIVADGRVLLYEGEAVVTNIYEDKAGKTRLVVQPKGGLIDIEAPARDKLLNASIGAAQSVMATHREIAGIDATFKSQVADLRYLLEDIRTLTESPALLADGRTAGTLLETLWPAVLPEVEQRMAAMDRLIFGMKLTAEKALEYKAYFQRMLNELLLQSPAIQRCYYKPLGYAGDWEMMRLNDLNEFMGPTLFGKLVSKFAADCQLGRATRVRTNSIATILKDLLTARKGEETRIISVACGPALEVQKLFDSEPALFERTTFTFLDQEPTALEYVLDRMYELRIKHGSSLKIEAVNDTIEMYLAGLGKQGIVPSFDFVYSFGLFDYFTQPVAKLLVRSMTKLLKPDGTLMITNISMDNCTSRLLLEFAMDWYLIYRSREEMFDLAKGVVGAKQITCDEIAGGTYKFLKIQKG